MEHSETKPVDNFEDAESNAKFEAANALKQSLLNQIAEAYGKFIEFVKTLPNSPFHQQQAFVRFDEGQFWLSQSIINAPVTFENIDLANPETSQPEAPQEPEPPQAA